MILPHDFESYTRQLMGDDLYQALTRGLAEEAPVSIRVNPFKAAKARPKHSEGVAWCPEGHYLEARPNFTFDPLLHAGLYYVQEASSMFITHVLRQLVHAPVLMLDLCAAPGGKTTAARTALPEGSLLFSNETVKLRAHVLAENVEKFGHPDTVVTNNFAADYSKAGLTFDVILTDVPCSGEGMFRKDEGAVADWSNDKVEQCSMLQRSILTDIWPALRPGGLLIYATCTYNAHEDEDNVNWIAEQLGADFVDIETRPEWHITGSLTDQHPVYRFIPGKTRGEGFFVAVLRKHGDGTPALTAESEAAPQHKKKKAPRDKKGKAVSDRHAPLPTDWLDGEYTTVSHNGQHFAIPTWWQSLYHTAAAQLRILHAGVPLATEKGRELIPHPALALSTRLRPEAFHRIELDAQQAIAYLRKEALQVDDAHKGMVLLTYRNQAIGFGKNVGNRINNLYPSEWKIRTTYLPEQPVEILPID